jgi:hypothetical protein
MDIPTFDQWFNSSKQFYCDLAVLCKQGEIQYINDCIISYPLSCENKIPRYVKNGYNVEDYFFVESVLFIESIREL